MNFPLITRSASEGPRLHEFSVLEKLQIFERVVHEWAPHLTDPELRLVLWMLRQTVSRGKRSAYYWLKQVTEGAGDRSDPRSAIGSGIPDKTLRRAIASARAKGVLHAEMTDKGTVFAVVLDWDPATGTATESNVVSLNLPRSVRRAQAATPVGSVGSETEFDTPGQNDRTPPGQNDRTPPVKMTGPTGQNDRHPIGTHTLPTFQGKNSDATASRPVQLPPVRKRVRANPVTASQTAPEKTQDRSGPGNVLPSPRCAPPPPTDLFGRDTVEAAIEKAQAARVARLQAARQRNDAYAYETTWAAAWGQTYPGRPCLAWTKKSAGMIKKAVSRWPEAALDSVHAFLEWVVGNWDAVRVTKLGKLKTNFPSQPDVEFLSRFISAFQEAWADKEELRWRGTQPGTRQSVIHLMRREGIAEDVALARVIAVQAAERDKEDLRKLAAMAKRDREIAQIAADNARRATGFTAANPHPRAHENTPKPVAMVPGEPDWTAFPKIVFDESKL